MSRIKRITEHQQDLIDQIMDEFNFERVHSTMKHLNWGWGCPATVPSLTELRTYARNMLRSLLLEGHHSTDCGGFKAEYFKKSKHWGEQLKLSFTLEYWSAGGDF
jgi:hypothetical protein